MFPSELLTANKKIMHVYESFCTPLCKKYQLNQSDLDLILFIANNPMYNTAKDVCEIRGIKKGIVSVTTERLVQSGYLIRKNDIHDRRIQRLCLTEKCQPIIADGREYGNIPAPHSHPQGSLPDNNADAFFHLCHCRTDGHRIKTLPGIIRKNPQSGDQIRKGVVKL